MHSLRQYEHAIKTFCCLFISTAVHFEAKRNVEDLERKVRDLEREGERKVQDLEREGRREREFERMETKRKMQDLERKMQNLQGEMRDLKRRDKGSSVEEISSEGSMHV
mmetsp:Transcript_10832/g.17737  ORF Transcript_10832/g.17737 Transcript_10832/m.17737 type:complete len:109 (-) Transcript_10832:587-913(-)